MKQQTILKHIQTILSEMWIIDNTCNENKAICLAWMDVDKLLIN